MYAFNYHRPQSLADAAKLLAQHGEAKLLSGGQTLIPTLKQRLASPSDVVDIGNIAELRKLEVSGRTVSIGAAVKHAEVASSAEVAKAIPALAKLASGIGDPQVRHMGTIGGSIANNDPAADYPAAVVGLNATVHTNKRAIPADKFFTGMFETALDDGEIITRVEFPIPEKAGYVKFPNPASRYAMVGVMVAKTGDGIRVAVTGAGPCVFRVPEMEKALGQNFSAAAVAGVKVKADGLNSDIHASAVYRASLVSTIASRAVTAAS